MSPISLSPHSASVPCQLELKQTWWLPAVICLLGWLLGVAAYLQVGGLLGAAFAGLLVLLPPSLWLAISIWRLPPE